MCLISWHVEGRFISAGRSCGGTAAVGAYLDPRDNHGWRVVAVHVPAAASVTADGCAVRANFCEPSRCFLPR